MNNILILTDFSAAANNAQEYAINAFNEKYNSKFILFNSLYVDTSITPYSTQVTEELSNESKLSLEKNTFETKAKYSDINIETFTGFGTLDEAVNMYLNDNYVDLIIMGCKEDSAFENFLVGSNTYEIIKNVDVPILLVPESLKFNEIKKVLYSSDYKNIIPEKKISILSNLVYDSGAHLSVLNVGDGTLVDRNSAEQRISSYFNEVTPIKFVYADSENVSDEINMYAEDNGIDLVTLVRHHLGFFDRLFTPSTTKKMVLSPKFPLLILHN